MAGVEREGDQRKRAEASRVEVLFREHNDALLRYLRGRLRSDADAHEAAQEAYVRLLQLDEPDQPSFLRGYLFKVAANVATDMIRRRLVRSTRLEWSEELPATQEAALMAREHLDLIERALAKLPPRCREAFRLSRHEGLKTVEIARRLGVTDRMVRLYLIDALECIGSLAPDEAQP